MKFTHTVEAYIAGGKHDDIRGTLLILSLLHVDTETGIETVYVGGKVGNVVLNTGDLVFLAESRKATRVVHKDSPDYKNYKAI